RRYSDTGLSRWSSLSPSPSTAWDGSTCTGGTSRSSEANEPSRGRGDAVSGSPSLALLQGDVTFGGPRQIHVDLQLRLGTGRADEDSPSSLQRHLHEVRGGQPTRPLLRSDPEVSDGHHLPPIQFGWCPFAEKLHGAGYLGEALGSRSHQAELSGDPQPRTLVQVRHPV